MAEGGFGKSLFGKFQSALGKPQLPPLCANDPTIAGIQKFIRSSGGQDVLQQRNSLALMPKTSLHVMTKYNDWRADGGAAEGGGPQAQKSDDQLALEEVTTFFNKLALIGFKKNPSLEDGAEEAELNLQLFPNAKSVQLTGITVTGSKFDTSITNVIAKDGAGFAGEARVFPSCTDVEISNCDPAALLGPIEGPVTGVSIANATVDLKALMTDATKLLKITRLEVVDCGWDTIPEAVGELAHLTALSVARNNISDVSHLARCTLLASLDVSKNQVQSLDSLLSEGSDTALLATLNTLDVSDNPLSSLAFVGPWLKALTVLNLSDCSVTDWAQVDRLTGASTLTSLYLTNNPIYKQSGLDVPARQMVVKVLNVPKPAEFVLDGTVLSAAEVALMSRAADADDEDDAEAKDGTDAAASPPADSKGAGAGAAEKAEGKAAPVVPPIPVQKTWRDALGIHAASPRGDADKDKDGGGYDEWPEEEKETSKKLKTTGRLSPAKVAACDPTDDAEKSIINLGGSSKKRVVKRVKRGPNSPRPPGSPVRGYAVETKTAEAQTVGVPSADSSVQCSISGAIEAMLCDQLVLKVRARLSSSQYDSATGSAVDGSFKTWLSGLVLCALLHDCNNRWVDYHNLTPSRHMDNLTKAVEVAHAQLGVPRPPGGMESLAGDIPTNCLYTSLVLMAVQEYELRDTTKTKQLSQRLLGEVRQYRSQRERDRQQLDALTGTRNRSMHYDPELESTDSGSDE